MAVIVAPAPFALAILIELPPAPPRTVAFIAQTPLGTVPE